MRTPCEPTGAHEFQSLIGRLKTPNQLLGLHEVLRFQSLIGRLKTATVAREYLLPRLFQSLIGRLKTVPPIVSVVSTEVSIPHR